MKFIFCLSMLLGLAACIADHHRTPEDGLQKNVKKRPNILLIVADDLGFSDIGVYGSEIETPNLDGLADKGVSFTNFHVTPACASTRAELMTGLDHHLVGIGSFPNMLSKSQIGHPGYEGYLNSRAYTIAEILKNQGYHTFFSGKWHLAHAGKGLPHQRGFEKAYDYTYGNADHFAIAARPIENGEMIKSVDDDFFSSNAITEQMINYLDYADPDRPFFAYLAFTAPHFALQAPDTFLNKYIGQYDGGYKDTREARLTRMGQLGEDGSSRITSNRDNLPDSLWEGLTPDAKLFQSRAMEVYAAMVDNLDWNIGRVLQLLRDQDKYKDTVIFFLSDNGASKVGMGTNVIKLMISNFKSSVERHGITFDNSLQNLGRKGSWVAYGLGWAGVSNTPFRHYKHSTSEGALRVPFIISGLAGKIQRQTYSHYTSVLDVVPTILELTQSSYPSRAPNGAEPVQLPGISLLTAIEGNFPAHTPDYYEGWELAGDKAIYQDGWKAISLLPPLGNEEWELYQIENDPSESHNLAGIAPNKLKELVGLWDSYREKNGVVTLDEKHPIKIMIGADDIPHGLRNQFK